MGVIVKAVLGVLNVIGLRFQVLADEFKAWAPSVIEVMSPPKRSAPH
jgi:hypothetical protein